MRDILLSSGREINGGVLASNTLLVSVAIIIIIIEMGSFVLPVTSKWVVR